MKIITSVPNTVADKLLAGDVVKAITDFENGYGKEAYEHLRDKSHLPNFFFGFVDNTTAFHNQESLYSNLPTYEKCATGYSILHLDIPNNQDNHLFFCGYYSFSDLLYYTQYETDEAYVAFLKENINGDYPREDRKLTMQLIQVIYPELKPEFLVSYYRVN